MVGIRFIELPNAKANVLPLIVAFATGLIAIGFEQPAFARTLRVGPDQALKVPSAAARIAAAGDTIEIAPKEGGYYDCAVWRADNLTIEGTGDGAVLTDTTCQGKAIFVIAGSNVTIRNLTFQRARVPDQNGAGIRAEGANLRVETSQFIDNESGILAANQPRSTITILDSRFTDNGRCERGHCTAAVQTGGLRLLHIEGCNFQAENAGDDIESEAQLTEVVNNRIVGGALRARGYLVDLPNGGSLIMRNNELQIGLTSNAPNPAVRVMAGIHAQPVRELSFVGNHLKNGTGTRLLFVSNWTDTPAQMQGNSFDGEVIRNSRSGYYFFMAKSFARYYLHRAKDLARALKSSISHHRL